MKKTLVLAVIAVLSLGTVNAVSLTTIPAASQVSNEVQSSGTIIELTSTGGALVEDVTGNVVEFINPRILNVGVGERYSFLKIIQSTPQGEKVIIILTTKLP